MPTLQARPWTSEEFLAGRETWQRLLAGSEADPLFMSWDWLARWWRHHQAALRAELCVLGLYTPTGELCGLAPFYSHQGTHRGIFTTRRLEFLGNTWRDSSAVFSEYLDLIAAGDAREAVCAAVRQWLQASQQWDELVLCNVRETSLAAQLAGSLANPAYLRAVESMLGWSIALPESFDAFAAGLSSNTRRKVLHQREKLGGVYCEVTDSQERRAALERLHRFVARRWRAATSIDSRTRFNAELAGQGKDTTDVRLTELRVGSNCVSVMLNLRVAGTEYYLQSGFDESHAHGLSPGYLHLGYAIEAACRDGIRRFDFLAGRGLHRDYKRDFSATAMPLRSLQVVRKRSLRALFRIVDRLRASRG